MKRVWGNAEKGEFGGNNMNGTYFMGEAFDN